MILGEDQPTAIVIGKFVLIGHRERASWAGFNAQTTEDAAQVIDLIHAAIALTWGEALFLGVLRTLDEDRIRRTGPGAQLAPDALLQTVWVAVQLVATMKTRLNRKIATALDLGVLLGVDLLEHRHEGDTKALDRAPHISHRCSPALAAR